MKHKLFCIFLLLPLLYGCEYEFGLEKMEGESRLQMICLALSGDNTYFKVNKAAAVNSRDTNPAVIEKMEFTVNGQSRIIDANLEDGGYYLVNSPVKAGDKIGLCVKAAGMKEASSETVVPEKVAVASIKAEFKRELVSELFVADTEDNLYFDVELDGKVSEDDFFAVEIKAHGICSFITEDGSEHVDEYDYHENIYDDSDFLSFESGKGSGWFSASYSGMKFGDGNDHYLFMTSGKSVVDGHLIVKTWFNNNYVYEDPDYNIRERGEYRYQLVLYKVSPECYRYCKARNLQSSNVLVEAGLSPATFSYTNVRNGFGVVGAISEPVFSEWYFSPGR